MPLGFVIFYLQHFGESKDFHQRSNGFYFLNIQVLHSLDILKQEDMGGCNNQCRITRGRRECNMDFSKWRPEMLHEIEYLVFHNYFVFFGKKKCFSSEIHVFRSNQFSLLMYRCLLPSSATVKMDYEEYMENAHINPRRPY